MKLNLFQYCKKLGWIIFIVILLIFLISFIVLSIKSNVYFIEQKIIEKTVEIPIEVYKDIDIVFQLNQFNSQRWILSYSKGSYSLTITINDIYTASFYGMTFEELLIFIDRVLEQEIQYRIKE